MMVAIVRPAASGETASELAVSGWRECKGCHFRCPLDEGHFAVASRPVSGEVRYRGKCRRCNTADAMARDRRLRTDPEMRDEYLAKRRKANADWSERNPDKREQYLDTDRESRKSPERKEAANYDRRQQYRRNIEAERARARERYHKDVERSRALMRRRYRKLKRDPKRWEAYREAQRRWYDANRDHVREVHRRWRKENADRVREVQRIWRELNRDRLKESRRQYAAENRVTINENRRISHRLKAEREGRPYRYRPEAITQTRWRLPVEPLRPLFTRLVATYGASETEAMTSADHKHIERIINGDQDATLAFDVCDRICVRLGFNLFDFWPDV